MKKPLIKFENITSDLIFSNSIFNFSNNSALKRNFYEKDDNKAIASDWNAVGKEVKTAIDRYGDLHKGETCQL